MVILLSLCTLISFSCFLPAEILYETSNGSIEGNKQENNQPCTYVLLWFLLDWLRDFSPACCDVGVVVFWSINYYAVTLLYAVCLLFLSFLSIVCFSPKHLHGVTLEEYVFWAEQTKIVSVGCNSVWNVLSMLCCVWACSL